MRSCLEFGPAYRLTSRAASPVLKILLNNLLYDISEIGIPFDTVRPEVLVRPQVWDMTSLVRFAAIMGGLPSAFDLLTFAGLLLVFHVAPEEFQSAWFLETMATQILVIFILRTNGRPWADLPHKWLIVSSLPALLVAMALPFTPLSDWFGFRAPPAGMLLRLVGIVVAYLVSAEALKPSVGRIYARIDASSPSLKAGALTAPLD
jgi:Mg2+-importing ATPase